MKWTRWTARVLAGLLLVAGGGCKRQLFMEPGDFNSALAAGPWAKLESQPADPIITPVVPPGSAPATILDPSRPARFVSLKEVVAIAMEQGNIGITPTSQAGGIIDNLQVVNTGRIQSDTIRAFALDPAIAGTEIERSLSKFDARFLTSMTWQKVDQAQPVAFQASLQNGDQATFSSTLAKPLPTGGLTGITFNTNYRNLSAPPPPGSAFAALPTSYSPQLQFIFEQPLLQSFGVEVNQLLPTHPGSTLIPGLRPSGGQGSEGILLTRIRYEQQKYEFDRNVNNMLFNVEAAYWNLYSAYYNLYAQEEGLKQSQDAYIFFKSRVEGGVARPQTQYQAQAQVELFRSQVLTARGQVLESERQLRGLLGMRSDDGTRLVPTDEPTLVAYKPDFAEVAQSALMNRPETLQARQELKALQLNLLLQKNNRRPDLRFVSSYDINGIGQRLDGNGDENALKVFNQNRFNNWQMGLRLDMPLGFRDGNAQVRAAELNVRRGYYGLLDYERKSIEYVTEQYRQVLLAHDLIKTRRAQRQALEKFVNLDLQVRQQGAVKGEEIQAFISNLTQSQRDLASATAAEFQAIAQYNTALAGLEYAKGTIQQYNNITVADGPLPKWVEKKAADHFKARESALKLREHPAELPLAPLHNFKPGQNDHDYTKPTPGAPGTLPLPLPTEMPKDFGPQPKPETVPPPKPLPGTPTFFPQPAPNPNPNPAPLPLSPNVTSTEPGDSTFKAVGTVTLPRRPGAAPAPETRPVTGTPAPGAPAAGAPPLLAAPPALQPVANPPASPTKFFPNEPSLMNR